jgi:cytochrome b561
MAKHSDRSAGVAAATRIAAGDDRTHYDNFAITLHWLIALLVVIEFALAHGWGFASRPTRNVMISAHISLGMLLSALIIVRVAWRLVPGHQMRAATSGFVELASKAVHYLLYTLLITQAALGYILRWSGNEAMSFFGIAIPPPFAPFSRPGHELVADFHNWIGWAIIIIAAGHAAAALFHHYALRDDVLWRMLPVSLERRMTFQVPPPEQGN